MVYVSIVLYAHIDILHFILNIVKIIITKYHCPSTSSSLKTFDNWFQLLPLLCRGHSASRDMMLSMWCAFFSNCVKLLSFNGSSIIVSWAALRLNRKFWSATTPLFTLILDFCCSAQTTWNQNNSNIIKFIWCFICFYVVTFLHTHRVEVQLRYI